MLAFVRSYLERWYRLLLHPLRLTVPLPPSRPLPPTSHIQNVYDAGGVSAVWIVDDAVCKVKILDPDATREHVTLRYLHGKRDLSFTIPEVYYHTEHDGRYYIILSRLPGKTLGEAWSALDEVAEQGYVSRIVDICKELALWRACAVSGVDGKHLVDLYLRRSGEAAADYSPQSLMLNCEALGMDCSALVFYHCDLGPGNIILSATGGAVAIIDWETAGFVPVEWIRTKFCLSGGLDLPGRDHDSRVDWRGESSESSRKKASPRSPTDGWPGKGTES